MQIQIVEHEAASLRKFQPTDHSEVFLDTDTGEVLILQDEQTFLITID